MERSQHLICLFVVLSCLLQTWPAPEIGRMEVDPDRQDSDCQRHADDPEDPKVF